MDGWIDGYMHEGRKADGSINNKPIEADRSMRACVRACVRMSGGRTDHGRVCQPPNFRRDCLLFRMNELGGTIVATWNNTAC
eukprot:scaffold77322_cov58-Phaeocystis_antarctica.AAC.4